MKKYLFSFIGILALLLSSCSEQWTPVDDAQDAKSFRVSFDVEGLTPALNGNKALVTRAELQALPEEMEVGSIFLLFFEATNDKTGGFVDYVEVKNIQDAVNGISPEHDIDMSGTQLDVTAAYNILAVANIHGSADYFNGMSISDWMLQWAGRTEQRVIDEAEAWTRSGNPIDPSELLMTGSAVKPANVFSVTIPLKRNQVRFDVINNIGTHTVTSIAIYNAYPISKLWSGASEDNALALDYSEATSRIMTYYGFNDASEIEKTAGNYLGYLYVFENQVAAPVRNDKLSTCLIIGMAEDTAPGDVTYYRVNIVPEDSGQMLKRNNSYRVTLNSVGAAGQDSPSAAYDFANDNTLDFTINQWDLNNQSAMAQDGSSMLTSPYKTVNLDLFTGEIVGYDPEQGQKATSFKLTTVTNSPTPVTPLAIIGTPKFQLNGTEGYQGIEVAINTDNELVFTHVDVAPQTPTPGALRSGDKITGTITVGYAGLRLEINVVQTDLTVDFLNVFLPEGGIPRFAPFGGIESSSIRVEASGPWTAKILSESTGAFGFVGTNVSEISNNDQHANFMEGITGPNENLFAVRTLSDNRDEQNAREAFIVVTLDSDPLNVSRLVRVTQAQAANIAITPSQPVTFNGTYDPAGTPLKGALASIANNTVYEYTVRPGNTGDELLGTLAQNAWGYRIEVDGTVVVKDGTVLDATKDWFVVTDVHTTDAGEPDGNTVSVDVTGKNTSGSTRRAKLVVYLTDSETFTTSIDLVQQSSGITLAPSTVPAVPKIGGTSQAVSIQADATLKWELRSITIPNASQLVHHDVTLVDQNGDEIVTGTQYSVQDDSFKVVFPKIYYPNREIPISAVVKVGIVDSELEATMTFTQTTLTPRSFVAYGLDGVPHYGMLGDTYSRGWDGESGNWGLRQIPGYTVLGRAAVSAATTVGNTVNYLHINPHVPGAAGASYNWSVVNNFMTNVDGLTSISNQAIEGIDPINNANSPLKKAGYPNSIYGEDINAVIDPRQSDTKIFQFIFDKGHTPVTDYSITDGPNHWYVDGVNTYIPRAGLPESAVVLISKHSTGSDTSPIGDNAMFIIDVENKFIWSGESQIFWYDYYLSNGRSNVLDNIMYYVANAVKYGSHFTDLLLEDGVSILDNVAVDGGRVAQPAPWDEDYWGANAGVPSK